MSVRQTRSYATKLENSKMVKIPSEIIKHFNLVNNQELTVTVLEASIMLTPVKKQPADIHELFDNWQDDGQREHELDWGTATGNEIEW